MPDPAVREKATPVSRWRQPQITDEAWALIAPLLPITAELKTQPKSIGSVFARNCCAIGCEEQPHRRAFHRSGAMGFGQLPSRCRFAA
jgi:hypothetical protein